MSDLGEGKKRIQSEPLGEPDHDIPRQPAPAQTPARPAEPVKDPVPVP